MKRRHRRTGTAVVLAVTVVAACSDGGNGEPGASEATAPPTADPPASEPQPTGSGTDPGPDETDGTDPTAPESTADDPTTTLGTVPDTGVPGIDSVDSFCRSWSEFAGSFQALALASAFGSDPGAAPRLEVGASDALIAAVDGLGEHLPDELESERGALVDELSGPMRRRAERARAELLAAGLDGDQIAQLGASWLDALVASGLDDPDIAVVVPDGVDTAAVETAVGAFAAELPPINQDPSLITEARIPLTEQYLGANCPDQGTLGGNDVIDEP